MLDASDLLLELKMEFEVKDMSCGGCANSITRAVNSVDPAARLDIDVTTKVVKIDSALPLDRLVPCVSLPTQQGIRFTGASSNSVDPNDGNGSVYAFRISTAISDRSRSASDRVRPLMVPPMFPDESSTIRALEPAI
jgi:copper chaperone